MDQAPETQEPFTGFPVAPETTDLGLNIPLDDCRGLSYDIDASMKTKDKGVQARLHETNPRALYVPCGACSRSAKK